MREQRYTQGYRSYRLEIIVDCHGTVEGEFIGRFFSRFLRLRRDIEFEEKVIARGLKGLPNDGLSRLSSEHGIRVCEKERPTFSY